MLRYSHCWCIVWTADDNESSAGGGGKSDYRKDKIKAKNERLEGQRKRATEQLKQEKARKEEIQKNGGEDAFAGLHPSRRNRLG